MSSPFLHKTISFSESCVGYLMLYVAVKFNCKMSQMLVQPFLAFANIQAPFFKKCWGDDITHLSGNVVTTLYPLYMTTLSAWVPSQGVIYVVIAGIKNGEGQCCPDTRQLQKSAAQKCYGSGFIEFGSGYGFGSSILSESGSM